MQMFRFCPPFALKTFSYPASNNDFHTKILYRLHYAVFIQKRHANVPFLSTVCTETLSYPASNDNDFHTKILYRLHYAVFIQKRHANVPFLSTVCTETLSYPASNDNEFHTKILYRLHYAVLYKNSMEMFRLCPPFALKQFPIQHQMTTIFIRKYYTVCTMPFLYKNVIM